MSIRFKFRSSLNFDTVDIGGRSSISVGELRLKIIRHKKLNVCQDFDLVFSDAASGQEFDDHSIQIPSGSSVIIKRVPAGRAPSNLPPIDAVGNYGVEDPVDDQMDRLVDLGADLCSVPDAVIPGFAPEFDLEKCGSSEKANVAGLRVEGPKLGSNDSEQYMPRGYNFSGDKEEIEKQMKLEKIIGPSYAPAEIIGLPSELKCSLCNTYFKEAVMIPCCQHSFCNKCIRLVLVEKARCPKCSSDKCKVRDLLPNLSLRQAIKHFLASQELKDSPENDLSKYAPDGESGIQAQDVSGTITILQREPELPYSPSVTGKGSNQVMEESFYSSVIRRNESFEASDYRMSSLAVGREISTPNLQTVKDIHGERGVYTHQSSVRDGPKDLDLTADCQGENTPLYLPQTHVHDEGYSTAKRKRGLWVETEGGDKNFIAAARPNKVIRTCYLCGSPDHLLRDCPAGSGPHHMLLAGPTMLQGGFPGYGSSYWNGAVFPPPRPFPNLYTNPGMMPFNASAVPMMRYRAPPYVPSVYGTLPPSGGIMRMGTMAPPLGNRAEHPLSHPEYLEPLHCEKTRKLSIESLHRERNCDNEDDIGEHHHYQEPERSLEYKIHQERKASASHSGDSFAQRSHKHQHDKHIDSDAYTVDVRLEKRSCCSIAGRDQKPYSERTDSGMQRLPCSANKNGEVRYKHNHRSSRKQHERKGQSDSDSSHGHHHQSDRDDVRWRVESDVRSSYNKQGSYSDSGLKPSSPGDKRKKHRDRDSGFESIHPRQSTKCTGEDLRDDRWQMVGGSDEDRRGDYCRHKRKRII